MFCEFKGCIWNEEERCTADNPYYEKDGDRVIYCDDLQVPDGVCKYCGEEIIEQYDWEEFWGQRVKRWYKDCGC